ncbi:hypothetical protein PAE9249_03122 [Paenibacillus sp. CECT 9249]|nr:hypothetical protein PAE9249_03122 [Paenibacillus sp. CECT 9249]
MYNAQKALGLGILPLFDTKVPYEELTKAAQEIGSPSILQNLAFNLRRYRRLRYCQ